MMRRAEAIAAILGCLSDELVVAANGWISRETCAARDRAENFYMLGSMGLASSIGLGLALTHSERRVVVFDGDGNLLMALGTLAMVAERRPANFLHIVFDNEVYGSTGGQRSLSAQVPLDALAQAAGYAHVVRVKETVELDAAVIELLGKSGPSFILIKVAPEADGDAPRVPHEPEWIAARLRETIAGSK
ncbi:MAG: sulfopyruvate decarboxylase subunit beta [Acidobacteriota bacterium]|jgi:thiamine pyrophosphate-dependent acetolactate synthase large subunit-like protein|nr:sulfopyruvate decarboxylase subunit beta [Acidobacteriota bacterium]